MTNKIKYIQEIQTKYLPNNVRLKNNNKKKDFISKYIECLLFFLNVTYVCSVVGLYFILFCLIKNLIQK